MDCSSYNVTDSIDSILCTGYKQRAKDRSARVDLNVPITEMSQPLIATPTANKEEHTMKNKILTALATGTFLAMAFAAPAASADDQRFSLSTDFDNSSNQYEAGPWVFKLTVPAGMSGAGGVPEIVGIRANGVTGRTRSGLADTEAAATYNLYPGSASSPEIDLTGKIKVNITDANTMFGLSQNDYAAQMDVYQSLDRFTAKGSVGSRVLGNPTGITLNPLLYGSFGGSYKLTEQASTGVDMSLSQDPSSTVVQQEISAYVNYKLDKNFKARGYVLRGFSNGNPNNVLGGQVYYGF